MRKCRSSWYKICLNPEGTVTPNPKIHTEYSTIWGTGQKFDIPYFFLLPKITLEISSVRRHQQLSLSTLKWIFMTFGGTENVLINISFKNFDYKIQTQVRPKYWYHDIFVFIYIWLLPWTNPAFPHYAMEADNLFSAVAAWDMDNSNFHNRTVSCS